MTLRKRWRYRLGTWARTLGLRRRPPRSEPPRASRGRVPSAAMDEQHLVRLLDLFAGRGIHVWLEGGWGVDALLGEQIREHDDVDLVVDVADLPQLSELLAA